MTLTMGGGPLAAEVPTTVNYRVEGPERLLFAHSFPRRVRAELAGETVLDTERGMLVHETGLRPVLYAPWEDFHHGRMEPSDHQTHCPFKGDAAYWHVRVGARRSDNAVWAYQAPLSDARWLGGMAAMNWKAADAWFDEDDQVHGHLRDPYHRVDARPSSTLVQVSLGEQTVALSSRPMLLSETGLPNRYYLPPRDVQRGLLTPSRTRTRCPYKGEATYYNLTVAGRELADAVWCYVHSLPDGPHIAGYFCFHHQELTIETERRP